MLFKKPLPFIRDYIDELNGAINKCCPGQNLTRIQRKWLSFCVMSIIITNSVCWTRFEKAGIGRYGLAALSWMFRNSKIPWALLLQISVAVVLKRYGITEGKIAIDDTDKKRSKSTKKIYHVHKIKDKSTGGYIMGQRLVFLVLISKKITIPVGFSFYIPDPALSAWRKTDAKLKKKGVPKKLRPAEPDRDPKYPTICQIALSLLEDFKSAHPDIRVKSILADALYGTGEFVDQASRIFGGIQVISQIRSNQNVRFRGKLWSVEKYFSTYRGIECSILIRGGKKINVILGSARLYLEAHGKKRFIIALKYEGEDEYRYIIGSDLSWRAIDIVKTYTFRWLIEVFFQDWKGNEGWGKMTKQPGEDGSSRSLILSLLVDHCLFFHPTQLARLENKLPAYTVGSLMTKIKVEGLLDTFERILLSDSPIEEFKSFAKAMEDHAVSLHLSQKHMAGRNIGEFEPSPSLKYKVAA
jgi:hypothetical protein